MIILLADTATTNLQISVMNHSDDGKANPLAQVSCEIPKYQHSLSFFKIIDPIIKSIGLDFDQIDLYGVCNGPGSYTGLRVGVSAAAGFATVFSKQLVTFSNIEMLAFAAGEQYLKDHQGAAKILSLVHARADEYYWGLYDFKPGLSKQGQVSKLFGLKPEHVNTEADITKLLTEYNEKIYITGANGGFDGLHDFAFLSVVKFPLSQITPLVLDKWQHVKDNGSSHLHCNYIRQPDAVRKKV